MIRDVMARARRLVGRRGPAVVALPPVAADATAADREALAAMADHTMTTVERQIAVLDAVSYLVDADVPGALVECGVWRGGSVLGMVLRLQQRGAAPRDVWLYDTFEGMTRPTDVDTSDYHPPALQLWEESDGRPYAHAFNEDRFSEQQVRDLLVGTGYPNEHQHLVVGPVEETIPDRVPDRIALLRLDTDWYESTRHELEHLYPRVEPGGVVIVDDYGHWKGARRAVDEYLSRADVAAPLLTRTDYACRMWVKPAARPA